MEKPILDREIPLAEMEKIGLYRNGRIWLDPEDLESMLAGRRSSMLHLTGLALNGLTLERIDAKLSLERKGNGEVGLKFHPVYREAILHPLLDKNEANQLQKGLLESVVKDREALVIEYDDQTREFVDFRPKHVPVPEEVNGQALAGKQREDFRHGKIVELEDGTRFRYSACEVNGIRSDSKRLVLSFAPNGVLSSRAVRGIRNLSSNPEQREGYSAGYNRAIAEMITGLTGKEPDVTVGEYSPIDREKQHIQAHNRTA